MPILLASDRIQLAMDDTKLREDIARFEASNKNVVVLYGGDGTLVGEWRKHYARKGGKCLLPVRNYGLCKKHLEFYTKFFTAREDSEENLSVKQFLFPLLRGSFKDKGIDNYLDSLSELTIVNADQTAALRFSIKINSKPIVENAIANGVIFATKLGSTGYFKSVARTIFTQGIGVGFINPTYSVPNIVVSSADKIQFELIRRAKLVLTADKLKQEVDAEAGWTLEAVDACDNVSILGYDHFMCPECRKNRNSTLVNDNYCVV